MKLILALAALSFAGPLVQDSKPKEATAEEFFKKVEEAYAAAATLKVKCEIVFDCEGAKGTSTIDIACSAGNRFKVEMKAKAGERDIAVTTTCDGQTIETNATPSEGPTKEKAPDQLAELLRRHLVRSGIMMPVNFGITADRIGDPADLPKVGEFKFLADEKAGERTLRVVEYGIEEHGKRGATAKIWVDAKSLEIGKRELKGEGDKAISITETYVGTDLGKPEPAKK